MDELTGELIEFRNIRGWEKYHTPENLAKSICIEAAELLKCFQWGMGWPDSQNWEDEFADIMIYCLYFAHAMGINIESAVLNKIRKNAVKYKLKNV